MDELWKVDHLNWATAESISFLPMKVYDKINKNILKSFVISLQKSWLQNPVCCIWDSELKSMLILARLINDPTSLQVLDDLLGQPH